MPLALARATLVALLLAPATTAQEPSPHDPKPEASGSRAITAWTRMVEQALAELDDEALAARAVQRLEHAGPAVLGFVRTQLGAERRGELSAAQIRGLLGVLASLGRASLAAIPELLGLAQTDLDRTNADMLAWTTLELLPFLPEERASDLLKSLPWDRIAAPKLPLFYAASLADDPGDTTLLEFLRADAAKCIVASRWIRVRAADPAAEFPYDRAALLAELDRLRRLDLQRPAIRLEPPDRRCSADLAEAWLALQGAPLDALAARALLSHWRADRRRQAVAWLAEYGANLPVRERADLAIALWDDDAEVRTAAAHALVGWQQQGFVGFAALHPMARDHADPAFRELCARSVEALAAQAAALPPADATLFAALHHDLREEPDPPAVGACSLAARTLVGDLLHLAPWCHADALGPLLQHVTAAGEPTRDAVQAVTGWIRAGDSDVQAEAWCFLTHWPTQVEAAWQANQVPVDTLRTMLMAGTQPATVGEAFEALAWLGTRNATPEQLAALCHHGNSREITRALAELLMRGKVRGDAVQPVAAARLQALVRGEFEPALVFPLPPSNERRLHAVLDDPGRILAALQCTAQGVPLPADDDSLDELLQEWCGNSRATLPSSMASWREDGSLAKRLDELEDRCRAALRLRKHLVWPSFAAR